jgi:hypothetical protein
MTVTMRDRAVRQTGSRGVTISVVVGTSRVEKNMGVPAKSLAAPDAKPEGAFSSLAVERFKALGHAAIGDSMQ